MNDDFNVAFLRSEGKLAKGDGIPETGVRFCEVADELERLQAIVAQLDETADHVRIVPGMVVWPQAKYFVEDESGGTVIFCVKDNATGELMEPFDGSMGWKPKVLFSTREAAEAAGGEPNG